MNTPQIIPHLFGNVFSSSILVSVAAKSAVLFFLAILVSVFLRKSTAAARHALWFGALASSLLLPFFSLGLPQWHVAWMPHLEQPVIAVTPEAKPQISAAPVIETKVTSAPAVLETNTPPAVFDHKTVPVTHRVNVASLLIQWMGVSWLAGALLALLPILAGWIQVVRLTRRGQTLDSAFWKTLLADGARDMRVGTKVHLLAASGMDMPFTWGALRPAVLYPDAVENWPDDRRRLVLMHELGHIKRLDWLTQTIGSLACALYWFNPLAWFAARQMRLERERACDDLVLASGQAPKDYARELLELAANASQGGFLNFAAVPMARHSTLEGRLLAILDAKRKRSALTRAAALAILGLIALITIPVAMLTAAPAPVQPVLSALNVQGTASPPALPWDDTSDFSGGLAKVERDGKWGYIDATGKVVIKPQWDAISNFSGDFAQVKRGDKSGFIDKSDKMVSEPQWDNVVDFSDGLAQVERNGKWGYIDTAGKVNVEPQWDAAFDFSGGLALVGRGGKYGFIDKTGNVLGNLQWDFAYSFSDGLAPAQSGQKWGYVDASGNVVIAPQWDDARSFSSGLAQVERGKKWGYIDKTGKVVLEPQWDIAGDFSNGVAAVQLGGKWSLIDTSGNAAARPLQDGTKDPFGGLIRVNRGGKWGFVDKSNNVVIEPQWDYAADFSGDLTRVNLGNKWGFIDRTGKVAIALQWDFANDFSGGYALVKRGDKFGFIDKTGKVLGTP